MIPVAYPETNFRIRNEKEARYIFDSIRKTWLLLTSEEWVRQNFVNYLVTSLHYPVSVIALEKGIMLNDLKKRFDILVYDSNYKPWMLVECKAAEIILNEIALQQVLRYHISVPVDYLVITNGNITIGWEKAGADLKLLERLPEWK